MSARKFTVDELRDKLSTRIELISRVPSVSNLIIAFEITDAIIVARFTERAIAPTERELDRFEKLRTLAMGTKNINERKVALGRALEKFNAIAFPVANETPNP